MYWAGPKYEFTTVRTTAQQSSRETKYIVIVTYSYIYKWGHSIKSIQYQSSSTGFSNSAHSTLQNIFFETIHDVFLFLVLHYLELIKRMAFLMDLLLNLWMALGKHLVKILKEEDIHQSKKYILSIDLFIMIDYSSAHNNWWMANERALIKICSTVPNMGLIWI